MSVCTELKDGDEIALVDNRNVDRKDVIGNFIYILRKFPIDIKPTIKRQDFSEILVSTKTEPIVIDSSSDEECSEDSEMGEPSRGANNDPVTRRLAEIIAERAVANERKAQEIKNTPEKTRNAYIVASSSSSSNKAKNELKMRIRFSPQSKKRKVDETEEKPLEPPPKLPRVLEQFVKSNKPSLPKSIPKKVTNGNKNHAFNKPLTPSPSGSPSTPRSPDFEKSKFNLDSMLSPSLSPIEPQAAKTDPIDAIVDTIVNWNAQSIMDKQFHKKAFHTHWVPVPKDCFENYIQYEKCVPNILVIYYFNSF